MCFSQEMKILSIEIKNFELHVSFKKLPREIYSFFNIDPKKSIKYMMLERGVLNNKGYPLLSLISVRVYRWLVRKKIVFYINRVYIKYNVGCYRADSFIYTKKVERWYFWRTYLRNLWWEYINCIVFEWEYLCLIE